jgi:hypothetical protein
MYKIFYASTWLILPGLLAASWIVLSVNPLVQFQFPSLPNILPPTCNLVMYYGAAIVLLVAPISRILLKLCLIACLTLGIYLNYEQFQYPSGFAARHGLQAARPYDLAELVKGECDGGLCDYAWIFMTFRPFLYHSTLYLPKSQGSYPDLFQLYNMARVSNVITEDYNHFLTEQKFNELRASAAHPAGFVTTIDSKRRTVFLIPAQQKKYRLFRYSDVLVICGADYVS